MTERDLERVMRCPYTAEEDALASARSVEPDEQFFPWPKQAPA